MVQQRSPAVATPAHPHQVRTRTVPEIFRLRPRAIWAFLLRQPASFWLINIYMFFEYVRPQSIWTWLAFLPWSSAALIFALVAVVVETGLPRFRTSGSALLLLFTAVLLLSSVTALYPGDSMAGMTLYVNWVLLFIVVTNSVTTEKRFFIFMLAFLLYSFKMSQHGTQAWVGRGFAFVSWGVSGAPGWFQNSGEFGIQMCIFLPLIVEFILALRQHWGKWTRRVIYLVPVTAVASIIASSSRGALVGAGAVAMWWVARSKHRVRSLAAIVIVVAAVWTVLPDEQKARFDTAGDDRTSVSRIERWEAGIELANQRPLLGIGYNNWYRALGPLSHNIFIEALTELGYLGLGAFLAMIGGTFWLNYRTRQLIRRAPVATPFIRHMAYGLDGALVGFMASGFFVTVLYYPYFWVNLSMTVALHVSARHERRRLAAAAAVA